MAVRSWIRKLFESRTPRTLRKAPARCRPSLETLEDRLAPATLGTYSVVEGPTAGTDSVVLADTAAWTATSNASYLHVTAGSTSGGGNALVKYSFDANTGTTRSGTFTIAGLTLTVTQAGSTYVAAYPATSLVSSGLNNPNGVAVDAAGNVYFADTVNDAIKEWNATTGMVSPLATGLNPFGVAVGATGNVYFADSGNSAIKQFNVLTGGTVNTLVSTGLLYPEGVAADAAGNVYIADSGNSAIKEWNVTTQQVSTLVSLGLISPYGVAVDAAGNVYFSGTGNNNVIEEWNATTQQVSTLVSTGLSQPSGVAVDATGNVYFADTGHNAIKEWNATTQQVSTLVSTGLSIPFGVAVDAAGKVYIGDTGDFAIKTATRGFVPGAAVSEGPAAGSDQLLPVLPTSQALTGPFAPRSDQPWLTLGTIANGVVNFSFTANTGTARTAHVTVLGQQITVTQSKPPALGTSSVVEGPAAATDSVAVVYGGAWTATSNASFLHVATGSAGGTGNAVIQYSFDANSGATRSGTLSIAGLTLTVTQAGSSYVAVYPPTSLVSSGLRSPYGVAVDAAGNVYIADTYNHAVKEWNATTKQVRTLVSGLYYPGGVAVDGAGNVYIADTANQAIKEWNATTQQVSTLVSSGLSSPEGVAVDAAGNVYIADTYNSAIKEWNATTQQVSTLVSTGLLIPYGVAVDATGNVYIADSLNNAIKEWNTTTQQVSTLVSGLSNPYGVAVDAAGNVYIADSLNNAIKEWNATTQQVRTLVSTGLNTPTGVALDAAGDVYIADSLNNAIKAATLTQVFVPGAAVSEGPAAGSDHLLPVLPTSQLLNGLFAPPSSDQSWLTLGTSANGVVNFSFTQNGGQQARTAHLTVLGRQITVTQVAPPFLGTTSVVEGPAAGTDSVVLSYGGTWTATSNASYLHVTTGSASGSGNAVIQYSFDANSGTTRSGTLTVAGLTLTVTQAGSTYIAANPLTTLVSSGPNGPGGVAVDGAGNVYIADTYNNAIEEWNATTGTVSTLAYSGLYLPFGVAVDGAGNVYIADTSNSAIKEWNATTGTVSTLVSSGLNSPFGVAVDAAGNVYIADTYNNAIEEWNATTGTVSTLVSSGLYGPHGVAVDAAGNVYIADTFNNAIKEWNATTQQVSTLVSTGLNTPFGVAVDAAGNVYIADTLNNAIEEWNATTQQVSTLVSTGLNTPGGVAVDAAGNVYIADTFNSAIKTLTRAFVPGAAVTEGSAAGSDHLLPVLPTSQSLTGPFAPSSDQSWLTLGTSANGVDNFSFTQNTGSARTAHIALLGQPITVQQNSPPRITSFTVPATGAEGNAVAVSATATTDLPSTLTYTWTVTPPTGAGNTITLTGASASFIPPDEGNYGVSLTVSENGGDSAVKTATVAVANVPPTITVFTVPASGFEGSPVTISATATDPSSAFDPLTYTWTITPPPGAGNTITRTGASASFTPPDEGNYGVSLTVSNGEVGGSAVKTGTVAVANVPPTITVFTVPASGFEGSPVTVSATATDPSSAFDPLTYTWTVTRPDGTTLTTLNGASAGFTPPDEGSYGVSLTVSDGDGGSAVKTAPIAVANVAPTPAMSCYSTGLGTQVLTYALSATDPSTVDLAGFAYSINWGDGSPVQTISPTAGNGSGVKVTHVFVNAGTYTVALTATDEDGGATTITRTVTALAVTSANLQTVITQQGSITTQDTNNTQAQTMVNAVNGLAVQTKAVTLTMNLGSANYTDLTPSPKAGITLVIKGGSGVGGVTITNGGSGYTAAPTVTFSAPQQAGGTPAAGTATVAGGVVTGVTITNPGSGYTTAPTVTFSLPISGTTAAGTARLVTTTIVGHSPALQVSGGNVIVTDLTLVTDTNSPTLVVTDGNLTLRNVDIEGNSAGSQAALDITGGNVDLGTAGDAGGNTFNAHGNGELIHNAGGNGVTAVGDAFEADGTPLTNPYRIKDKIFDALNAGGGGLVTYVPGNDYITVNGGSIQRGVDAIAEGGTVNVEAGSYNQYDAGSKLVTVHFEGGPTLSQQPNPQDPTLRDLVVTGTAGDDHIQFTQGGGAVQAQVQGVPNGRFNPNGRIVAYGMAGNDDIKVAGGITLPAYLFGGDGNDTLQGGGGDNVLVGGAGDDMLLSGKGRGLLIGGLGADQLVGNSGDDLLISGTTAFDSNVAALDAIMAEWTSARSYAERVANLSGSGSGPRANGDVFLTASGPGATVSDDGAVNWLQAGSGMNWYFAKLSGNTTDIIRGLHDSEIVVDLGS